MTVCNDYPYLTHNKSAVLGFLKGFNAHEGCYYDYRIN